MRRILWVDDNYRQLRGLAWPLEKAGYVVDGVETVARAVQALQDGADYDMAIVDILLPLDDPGRHALPADMQRCLDLGRVTAGECLLRHLRVNLRWNATLVVCSNMGQDAALRERLWPLEISAFLVKGDLSSDSFSGQIEEVLGKYDPVLPLVLDLRFGRMEQRRLALQAARSVPLNLRLQHALVEVTQIEPDPWLRRQAQALLRGEVDPQDPAKAQPGTTLLPEGQVALLFHRSDAPMAEVLGYHLWQSGLPCLLVGWPQPLAAATGALMRAKTIIYLLGSATANIGCGTSTDQAALPLRLPPRARVLAALLPGASDLRKLALVPRELRSPASKWIDLREIFPDNDAVQRLRAVLLEGR
jgi:CheY-like chemotaxis protein